jgi:hypothetical protein
VPAGLTYAQNFCCGAPMHIQSDGTRYQTHSDCKLLIYNGLKVCLISRHFGESLDFQGFGGGGDEISTKLSTETMNGV